MRKVPRSTALAAGALASLAIACPDREVKRIDPEPQGEHYKEIPVGQNRDVDILFVIDNSSSMSGEQTSLKTNFPAFINVLESIEGGLPNVHIGVVTSDVGVNGYDFGNCQGEGDDGFLISSPQAGNTCTAPSGTFIRDVKRADGTRDRNYPAGKLAETFGCIAEVGDDGCGFEKHLEAMRRALDGRNKEFHRKNAYLAVIFLADEDDCSVTEQGGIIFDYDEQIDNVSSTLGPYDSFRCTEFGVVCDDGLIERTTKTYGTCVPRKEDDLAKQLVAHPQEYVTFLKNLKGTGSSDDNKIIIANIVGNPDKLKVLTNDKGRPKLEPSCQSTNGKADPAHRLDWFRKQFQKNTFVSICNSDLTDALTEIAELLKRAIDDPCIEGAVNTTDAQPNQPGLQINCEVADVKFSGTDEEDQKQLPRCPMQDENTPVPSTDASNPPRPCWYVKAEPTKCASKPSQLALIVDRNGAEPEDGTSIIMRCATVGE
ncbi:MAG: VWA domain-containing protein [Deltaproteobacteria bacterium]|nr:VWA domain-containing protein [Deltaproteobacteria bacterium]